MRAFETHLPLEPEGLHRPSLHRSRGPARRDQPRLRDSAHDDVPSRGVGLLARAQQQPLSRHQEEPEEQSRLVPRRGRTGSGAREVDTFLFPRYAGRQGGIQPRVVLARSLRLHDLRYTTASHAVMSGENLPLVGH